ncbi:MAG: hypothetical protein R6X10_01270 [Desulfobacterales bacterium]
MKRLYFIFGDLAANSFIGSITAILTASLVGNSWHMLFAMAAGFAVGMILSLILGGFIFVPLFGAMEVTVPTMISGIASGMVVGIWASIASLDPFMVIVVGAFIGIISIILTYSFNIALIGRKTFH